MKSDKRTTIQLVQEFHEAFGVKPDDKNRAGRTKWLREEIQELDDAIAANDRVAILDALTDIQYFLDGTYIVFQLDSFKDAAFAEVHRSNLSKLDENGKAIVDDDGKIMKGKNYSPPNLHVVMFGKKKHE